MNNIDFKFSIRKGLIRLEDGRKLFAHKIPFEGGNAYVYKDPAAYGPFLNILATAKGVLCELS